MAFVEMSSTPGPKVFFLLFVVFLSKTTYDKLNEKRVGQKVFFLFFSVFHLSS